MPNHTAGIVLGSMVDNQQLFALLDRGLYILFLLAFLLYVIFAFIATRQIDLMKKTLKTPFSGAVHLLGLIHFFIAVAVFIAFLWWR